jgi:hypothetical protein
MKLYLRDKGCMETARSAAGRGKARLLRKHKQAAALSFFCCLLGPLYKFYTCLAFGAQSLDIDLGYKPRSPIRVSLGWIEYSKKIHVRKDNPTPAYLPVHDRRRLTALVEVHWARRVQTPMLQISGLDVQENHIIETCKEEGCAVSTQEAAA